MRIPKEFHDATLFAITPDRKCVGIEVFSESDQTIEFDRTSGLLEAFIGFALKRAIELKLSIENGLCGTEKNKKILQNPSTNWIDSETLIRTRLKGED